MLLLNKAIVSYMKTNYVYQVAILTKKKCKYKHVVSTWIFYVETHICLLMFWAFQC